MAADSGIDFNFVRFVWDVAQTLITLGVALYVFITSRSQVNASRIKELESSNDLRFDKLSERVTRTEEQLKQGPTHDDLKNIFQRLNGMSREISTIKGEFSGVKENTKRIHDFLLHHNGVK